MGERELLRNVSGLIAEAESYSELNKKDIAKLIGCSQNAFNYKQKRLDCLKVSELAKIAELAGREIVFTDKGGKR